MKLLQAFLTIASLVFVLVLSLLLVILNPDLVQFDVFGFLTLRQNLGILLLFFFILGIVFALALTFIPSSLLTWRNKRLQKKIKN